MAINYYVGWSIEDLENKLRNLQEQKAEASRVIAATGADTYSQFEPSPNLDKEIQQILAALNLLDPEKYPSSVTERTVRTTPRYL